MPPDVDIDRLIHSTTVTLDTRGRKRINAGEEYANETVKVIILEPNSNN